MEIKIKTFEIPNVRRWYCCLGAIPRSGPTLHNFWEGYIAHYEPEMLNDNRFSWKLRPNLRNTLNEEVTFIRAPFFKSGLTQNIFCEMLYHAPNDDLIGNWDQIGHHFKNWIHARSPKCCFWRLKIWHTAIWAPFLKFNLPKARSLKSRLIGL